MAVSSMILVVPFIVGAAAFAGTSDSSPRWEEMAIAQLPGIEDAQLSVRMLGQEVNGVHITGHVVTLANPLGRVSLALPPSGCGSREKTTVTAQLHRPMCKLAVNAGYFDVTDGSCIGNVVSHGNIIQTVPLPQGNVNFGIKDGKFIIGYLEPSEITGFEHIVSGVVWLVRDGVNYVKQGWSEANTTVQTSGDKYATNLASRTAVGYDAVGRLIIVQIDGSIAVGHNKRGMDMSMVADLLIKHGAVNAINLDGGGSSAMSYGGVLINYPSDNRPPSCDASGLYQCERAVSTILCVHEKDGVDAGLSTVSDVVPKTSDSSPLSLMVGSAAICMLGATFALFAPRLLSKIFREDSDDDGPAQQLSSQTWKGVQPGQRYL